MVCPFQKLEHKAAWRLRCHVHAVDNSDAMSTNTVTSWSRNLGQPAIVHHMSFVNWCGKISFPTQTKYHLTVHVSAYKKLDFIR